MEVFLPQSRDHWIEEFRRPAQEIPWDIVQAFRLENPHSPWSTGSNNDPDYDYVPTPEEEQAILDEEDRQIYGDPQPSYPSTTRKPLIQTKHEPWPDEPPF